MLTQPQLLYLACLKTVRSVKHFEAQAHFGDAFATLRVDLGPAARPEIASLLIANQMVAMRSTDDLLLRELTSYALECAMDVLPRDSLFSPPPRVEAVSKVSDGCGRTHTITHFEDGSAECSESQENAEAT